MTRLRVLVAEDSPTVRARIVETLSAVPDVEVVGEAADGADAIEACARLRPSVITLDIVMPNTSGLHATEQIMAHCPTPILIVSGSSNRRELFNTYDALAAGAVDVLEKPLGTEPEGVWEAQLVAAVRRVARIRVITHSRGRRSSLVPTTPSSPGPGSRCRAVVIGASTGGPGAVKQVLDSLPANFPIPVIVLIHIGAPFGDALADWLGDACPLEVSQARHGQLLPTDGRVLMAPPDRHLVLERGRLLLVDGPPRHSCRPSVDVLFESVAADLGPAAAACLLTGMGRDGAAGLLAIRRAGGRTITQDEATSVVFGMPREAIALGAAEQVLPLSRIGAALRNLGGAP